MTGRKNLCAHIPIALHEKVSAARAEAGLNTNDYVTQVLTEYYDWKENGGNIMARKTENTRTFAFQIPEELFQRIKEHLEKESKRRGIRLTQRDFVVETYRNGNMSLYAGCNDGQQAREGEALPSNHAHARVATPARICAVCTS